MLGTVLIDGTGLEMIIDAVEEDEAGSDETIVSMPSAGDRIESAMIALEGVEIEEPLCCSLGPPSTLVLGWGRGAPSICAGAGRGVVNHAPASRARTASRTTRLLLVRLPPLPVLLPDGRVAGVGWKWVIRQGTTPAVVEQEEEEDGIA